MKHIPIFSALLVALLVGLCSNSSETLLNGRVETIGNWNIPKVGTEYVYQFRPNDSTAPTSDTFTIVKTGQRVGGKTNVVIATVSFRGRVDTEVYNIEPNGNFSLGIASEHAVDSMGHVLPNIIYIWKTFPIYSRNTIAALPPGNFFDAVGNHFISSDQCTLVGTETLSSQAGEFSTLHARETEIDDESFAKNSQNTYTDTAFTDIWFAPTIGLYVKWVQHAEMNSRTISEANINLIKYLPQ